MITIIQYKVYSFYPFVIIVIKIFSVDVRFTRTDSGKFYISVINFDNALKKLPTTMWVIFVVIILGQYFDKLPVM